MKERISSWPHYQRSTFYGFSPFVNQNDRQQGVQPRTTNPNDENKHSGWTIPEYLFILTLSTTRRICVRSKFGKLRSTFGLCHDNDVVINSKDWLQCAKSAQTEKLELKICQRSGRPLLLLNNAIKMKQASTYIVYSV